MRKLGEEEVDYIKNNCLTLSAKQISKELQRSEAIIRKIIKQLGMYDERVTIKWSKKDEDFLIKNHLLLDVSDIAKTLNRTELSINNKAFKLNLKKDVYPHWSEEEREYLKEHYFKKDISEISSVLNRTVIAAKAEARKLKLFVYTRYESNEVINDYAINNMRVKDLSLKYKCTEGTINRLLNAHDVERRNDSVIVSNSNHFAWKGFGEISGVIFNRIKRNAETRNIKFNITLEQMWNLFLKQDRKCALSGQTLFFAKTNRSISDTTSSLDRIDSKKDYMVDNIQWIHKHINQMKMHLDEKYFINLCGLISNYKKDLTHKLNMSINIDNIRIRLNSARSGSKVRNLDFNITLDYIVECFEKQFYRCNLSGLDLDNNFLSIDRIDSKLGYIKDNIQLVHRDVNYMKRNFHQDDFINWCGLIYNHNKKENQCI